MKILRSITEYQSWRKSLPSSQRLGFVPTMGALHAGHASLLKKARSENDVLVLSIYVNPTQFNDPKDFEKYPNTWEQDLKLAEQERVSTVFAPTYPQLYPDDYCYRVSENKLSLDLCGAHRPGHFDGVLSVVMKLFNIVQPHKAYFGEKDFQQLQLIKGMVESFFMPIEIIAVETIRDSDGLAMSSRNVRLTELERKLAPQLFNIISSSESAKEASEKLKQAGFKIDYVKDVGGRRFVAAFLGAVRLIDNVKI